MDHWNLICQGSDGGDSANRTSIYLLVKSWENAPDSSLWTKLVSYLTRPDYPGILRRHPDPTKWYSDWDRMSRDQTYPFIMAAKEYGDSNTVWSYILGHFLRLFLFTTNIRNNGATAANDGTIYDPVSGTKWNYGVKLPDITGPDFWAVEIRALPTLVGVCLYPLLCVLDLYTLFSAMFLRWYNTDQNDVINHVIMSVFNSKYLPTPFTWIMNKFINNASDLNRRLAIFFSGEGQPRMDKLVEGLVNSTFN